MYYCGNCGAEVKRSQGSCPRCGARFVGEKIIYNNYNQSAQNDELSTGDKIWAAIGIGGFAVFVFIWLIMGIGM